MAPKQLNFITGNKHKLVEVQAMIGNTIELQSQSLDIVEIQGTIEEIVTDKCRRAADQVNGPVLVEDTCLCFKALGDLPGPYIKWFELAIGLKGLNNLLMAYEDKSAQAVCTFAYSAGPGHEPLIFQGRVDGKIVPERGPKGFVGEAFDPIFEYEGRTFAEMGPQEKNKISHRFKAMEKLKTWLQESS